MKPTVPDSPALRDLLNQPREDLEAEVLTAQQFREAAETYLAWAQISLQLADKLEAITERVNASTAELRAMTASLSSLPRPGASSPVRANGRPSLRRAILAVLATRPDEVWRKREIFNALRESGWEPRGQKPEAQLATRLAEMIDRGEIVRVSIGHYMLADAYQDLREASPSQGGRA